MNNYEWETEDELSNNELTMSDYLDNHMNEAWDVLFLDGTYAEIRTDTDMVYEAHASGNGDFRSHKIEFKEMVKCS